MRILRLLNVLTVILLASPVVALASLYPGLAALAAICGLAVLRRTVHLTAFGTARWAEAKDLGDMLQ
jgi:hypothetical protein